MVASTQPAIQTPILYRSRLCRGKGQPQFERSGGAGFHESDVRGSPSDCANHRSQEDGRVESRRRVGRPCVGMQFC
jgi:hypothetical protein